MNLTSLGANSTSPIPVTGAALTRAVFGVIRIVRRKFMPTNTVRLASVCDAVDRSCKSILGNSITHVLYVRSEK